MRREEEGTSVVECCRPISSISCGENSAWDNSGSGLTNGADGPPAEQFSEGSEEVGKVISISEGGHVRTADDPV